MSPPLRPPLSDAAESIHCVRSRRPSTAQQWFKVGRGLKFDSIEFSRSHWLAPQGLTIKGIYLNVYTQGGGHVVFYSNGGDWPYVFDDN